MTPPHWHFSALDYREIPGYGAEHLLSRLNSGELRSARFPLLGRGEIPEPSASPFMDRVRLTEILNATNGAVAAGTAPATAPAATTTAGRYVVAGQQAGLLTGPLYTFLKALTIIRLASDLETTTGIPHIPLFWMASEDHDLLEVNRCWVNGRRFVAGDPASLDAHLARRRQVADEPLTHHRNALCRFVRESLPENAPFRDHAVDLVESSSFADYGAHFRSLMLSLFADLGLLIADPLALRPLTAPVLAELVARWGDVVAAFADGGAQLRREGFTPPLAEPGLFEIRDGARLKIEISPDGAQLAAGRCSLAELAAQIRAEPAAFSPNAALRPVLQDAVIPVSAFVAGPTELLYLWQIDGIYDVAGTRRALLRPRISATFVEPRVARAARKQGLAGSRILAANDLLHGGAHTTPDTEPNGGTPASHSNGDDADLQAIERGGDLVLGALDRVLGTQRNKALERGRAAIASQLEKVAHRIRELKAEAAGRGRRNLETIATALTPEGKPQERMITAIELLSRHGPSLVKLALDALDPWPIAHHLVETGRSAGEGALRERASRSDASHADRSVNDRDDETRCKNNRHNDQSN